MSNFFAIIFLIAALIQFFYWAGFLISYFIQQATKETIPSEKVSILICLKNEAQNVNQLMSALLEQDYPRDLMEIILVNDNSSDTTGELIDAWATKYAFIKCLHLGNEKIRNLPGKKYALSKGVQLAKLPWLLLTDADCVPASKDWINKMLASASTQNASVVLAYGAYSKAANAPTLLQNFIQFETLHTAIQYFSYTLFGLPYMGVGRNLLYKTSCLQACFQDGNLLEKLQKTSSGDDDLIISHLAQKEKIVINSSFQAATVSKPPIHWQDYFKQKSRHTSSSKFYNWNTKANLGLYAVSHFLFWILGIIVLLFLPFQSINLLLIILVIVVKILGLYFWKKQTRVPESTFTLVLMDFLWSIYNVILSPYIFWKNKQQWI